MNKICTWFMPHLLSFFAAATLLGGATPKEAQEQDLVVFKVQLHPVASLREGSYVLEIRGSFETDNPSSLHDFHVSTRASTDFMDTGEIKFRVQHLTSTSHLDFTPTIKKITITNVRVVHTPPRCCFLAEESHHLMFELSLYGSSDSFLDATFTPPTLRVNLGNERYEANNFAPLAKFSDWRYFGFYDALCVLF